MVLACTGFEHAIANMAIVPLGLMYGANADYRKWLCQNLLLVIAGNLIGGALVVGVVEHFLNDWARMLALVQDQQADLEAGSGGADPSLDYEAARDGTG
jgi:hypothetical protein